MKKNLWILCLLFSQIYATPPEFSQESMRLLIIGTGYVGLISGACFAEKGHQVICLDVDKDKIENLKKGIIPIYEPGLKKLIQKNTSRIKFTTDYKTAVKQSDLCFICVPTPSNKDGSCNLSYVESVVKKLAEEMQSYKIIINKSTSPIGTVDKIEKLLSENIKDKNIKFSVVSNPEFLKEGSAIEDCLNPDRVVIGLKNSELKKVMGNLYKGFNLKKDQLIFMDPRSAEMTKYAANTMLASRISLMNEIANICTLTGANIENVKRGIGTDKRIGKYFLNAGVGYGGSCFPKDVRALSSLAKKHGYTPEILDSIESVNNRQKICLAEKMVSYFSDKGGINGKIIALWGLAFKPGTDDMRNAPSLALIKELQKKGAILHLYDPISMDITKKILEDKTNITFFTTKEEAAKNADALALVTEWSQFQSVDFKPILQKMKGAGFFDGRNQHQPKPMTELGFDYFGIGIPDQVL